MEVFLSALLGELSARSINFFISKISKQTPLNVEDPLCKLFLRAQVIIDEAMWWHITNQAMLLQLDMLRDAVHRGYYRLDAVRNMEVFKQLEETLDGLSSIILDMKELVMFLTSYPRLYCQPYSMHLQLANCMFGRQTEAQLVLGFLLHLHPHGVEELDVMPIVGPAHVGKSTLVAHVCMDERVRSHFLEILFFHIKDLTDDELATFKDECDLKHQNCVSESNTDGRLLIVIELLGDLNEDAWSRLYYASKQYAPRGIKIIITSRFDNIVKFGRTWALTLKYLPHEAYWYFFKTLKFGSADPEMHPRLMHLAMEIARVQKGSPIGANMIAHLLRDNFNAHFWCKVLSFLRGSYSRFSERPFDLLNQNRPAHLVRMTTPSEDIMLYDRYQCSLEEEVPKITFGDVLDGSVKPHGRFQVLAWRSVIPPYYSYVDTCEIQELRTRAAKRKLSMRNGVLNC